jgi:Ran GTPase-activating protein (RanGAP) involved in mRNA processing and transport
MDDAELKLILDAAKKNKTLKKVLLVGSTYGGTMSLSVPAALSLASVVSEHPKIQEIEFCNVSFIEFGPIALAIQHSRKLTRLLLVRCEVTQNLVECIRWLLTENALESMTLNYNQRDEDSPLDISGALLRNSSLKELVIHDEDRVFGSETFQAIPHMIRTNHDFETIDLSPSNDMTDRYELVRLIAQAAEGHASLNKLAIDYPDDSSNEEPSAEVLINHGGTAEAIGMMLYNAPALREFSLSGCYMGSAGARHLADGLTSKTGVIEKLVLSSNKLGAEEAGIFARVLLANKNLKSLVLSFNNIGDAGALELAVALRQNNTLDLLDLWSNDIHSDGARALADTLAANDSLKDLYLRRNFIGDDGATSIAEMLTRNESIKKVCVGGFGEMGLKAFATRLSTMNGLKTLIVGFQHDTRGYISGYTSEIGNSFVLALEQNTTLETFDSYAMQNDFEVMPQVRRLLALNRGGRRLLSATGESVPPLTYWPRILARSSDNADVLFHFLREIPNVLVENAGSRKRKHGDDDETTSTM